MSFTKTQLDVIRTDLMKSATLRLLIVCTVPTVISGIPNVIFNLFQGTDWKGIEIGYVAINEPPEFYKKQLDASNIKLYILQRKIFSSIQYIRKLIKVAQNYDVIHVHGNSATMVLEMLAAKFAGIKVRIAHSHNTTCSLKTIDLLMRPLFHYICNGRFACGEEAGKWLFGRRSFKIINNGINAENYRFNEKSRQSIRKLFNISNEIVIGHIGNFVEQKNHEFILKVFESVHRLHPTTKLLLLGDGPLKSDIMNNAKKLGLFQNVIFAGSVTNAGEFMSAMDIILMPSKFEGLPLTMIEEQANGLSILASDAITQDANVTNYVHYLPLNISPELWEEKLFSIISTFFHNEKSSETAIRMIKNSGYDIAEISKGLKSFYISSFHKVNSLN